MRDATGVWFPVGVPSVSVALPVALWGRLQFPTVQRILVAGVSGAGKTTFAQELSRRLDLPFHEMDGLFHGPGWEPIPTFVADVEAIASGDRWVFDSYGYAAVRDLVWSLADTVIWLDYSRPVVLTRVLRRSTRRTLLGEPTFNGNVERWAEWRRADHPVQWSMRRFLPLRTDMEHRFADPAYAEIHKVRIRRPAAARWWLDRLGEPMEPEAATGAQT